MSIYSLCGEFAKTQKRCYKKNIIILKLQQRGKKCQKKKFRLFVILNCNIYNTHNKNYDIVILCCDSSKLKKNHNSHNANYKKNNMVQSDKIFVFLTSWQNHDNLHF